MSEYIDDGKIWAYYNVNTTESATKLIDSTTGIGSTMIVDGVSVSVATSYTFDTTGEHLVKFTPTTAYVGRGVFRNIGRLTELYLPSTITRTDGANETTCSIRGCSLLSKIHLSTSFRQIYPCDFSNLSALTEIENIEYVTRLGNYTLQNCPNLKIELNLPNLTTIGDRIGLNSGFTKIVSLGSITSLPGGANTSNAPFLGCSQLMEATLPATLTSISNYSFYNCPKLKRVNFLRGTPPTLGTGVFSGTTSLVAICVPSDSVSTYKTTWTSYASKIYPIGDSVPMNIAGLANGRWRRRLMMGMSTKSKDYPDPWEDDGWIWAYYDVITTDEPTTLVYTDLSYLGATFIIDGVEVARTASYTFDTTGEHLVKMQRSDSVRASTFRVARLVRIYFPDTVTGIGEACFLNDANLTHVWLPDTITTITNRAFEGCSSLRVINVDNTSITTVNGSSNYGTFRNCTSLRKLHFPVTVTSFGQRSVQGCSSLIDVNLSDLTSLVSIGALAFGSGTKLRGTWKAPSTFTTLGNQSFASTKLEEVDLGDSSVTTIPGSTNYGCFMSCSVLSKVILPDTTTTLQQRAFYQCYALATVICKATTPPTISGQSLPGTSYVQHIYVPAESVEDYKAASGWSSYASKIEAIPTT